MAIRTIAASLFIAASLVLGACGTNDSATSQPADIANQPTTAPATADAQLDQPLLEAPTAAPTSLPTEAPMATSAPTDVPAPTVVPATPTPAPQSVQRIVIGAIDLDYETVSVGLDERSIPVVPKHDVGWYNLSAAPGQGDNVVLWGHVLRFRDSPDIPAPFRRVNELKPGAEITVYDDTNTPHSYTVAEQVWVTPDQIQYIMPTGSEQLTLVSCIGDKVKSEAGVEMTHRLITIAKPAS